MAAGSVLLYDFYCKYCLGANADLDTNTVKLALVASTYSPTQATDDTWADVSANEISNGFGYTSDGYTLLSPVLTAITDGFKFSSANPVWTASGGPIPAWRYGVFYVSGTINGVVNPLIGYFLGDATPADVPATTDTNILTITCPANGWFGLTRAA